jgi:large subunit ribosomal protein L22
VPGPKLNERPVLRNRHSGRTRPASSAGVSAKAVAKYVRVSPYKVREVLDLVRGHHVERAQEILRFSERDAAAVVAKVLDSAIANAEHNEQVVSDELFVSACFADEGPTLKRWRPRARGRATRIRKRTCHITVVVSRLPESELGRRRDQRPGAVTERRRRGGQDDGGRARRRRTAAEPAAEPAAPTAVERPAGEVEPAADADEAAPETTAEAEAPAVEDAETTPDAGPASTGGEAADSASDEAADTESGEAADSASGEAAEEQS